MADIAVVADNPDAVPRAKRLAEDFGLTCICATDYQLLERFAYQLRISENYPALVATDNSHGAVTINFTQGRVAHRRRFGGGKNQPLARAVGVAKPDINYVVDATAGFGADAFVLASLGCSVTLLERNAALAALLTHAVAAAGADPDHGQNYTKGSSPESDSETREIARRMSVVHTDASAWLLDKTNSYQADAIYLDPMYPGKSKSALAKKNMQVLQTIAGPDTDSNTLLSAALTAAAKRVVVKRPKGAETLDGQAPDTSISSSKTRYDIYLINP